MSLYLGPSFPDPDPAPTPPIPVGGALPGAAGIAQAQAIGCVDGANRPSHAGYGPRAVAAQGPVPGRQGPAHISGKKTPVIRTQLVAKYALAVRAEEVTAASA